MWQGAILGATGPEFEEEIVGVLGCRKWSLAAAGTRRRFAVMLVTVGVVEEREGMF